MGILNVTPDSFSDGGQYLTPAAAVTQANRMAQAGAAIIDIGGESTRPGALPVSVQEECDRVLPVIEAVVAQCDVIVSVDTSTPEVMSAAADLGAGLLNDVRALQRPGALQAAAATALPVCLMHMQGQPSNMQLQPTYQDVIADIQRFLHERAEQAIAAGIAADKIIVDPGFGFGKQLSHNLQLLNDLPSFSARYPVLVGMSRKSMIGEILGKAIAERLNGTLALTAAAVMQGAFLVRVHDVAENVDAVRIINALIAAAQN